MEENKPTSLWDRNEQTPTTLRQPNSPAPNLLNTNEARTEPKKKFVLSAEAPEWYPSNYQPPNANSSVSGSGHSVQNRLKKFKEPEGVRNNFTESQTASSSQQDGYICDEDSDCSTDVSRLRQIINTLTSDPGQFNELVDLFIETLYPHFRDPIMLYKVSEILVRQAINNQSFRYTAARLCCVIEQGCPEIRAPLHLNCKKELDLNDNKQGLLLFVAELYTQLGHENIYGTYLIDAFKQILSEGGNDNVKSICQALKLTGSSLELYDAVALDEVFARLNELKPTTSGTALSLLNSVTNLRKCQWGQSNTPSNHSLSDGDNEQEGFPWRDSSTTVNYDTDGYRFTSEEYDFLASNIQSSDDYVGENDSDPDELCDPEPEMDEEIQAAFKEFVKYSKR